ncbi:flavin-binding monooxygenase, putative [Talaromyces stipitatus ATCC 10500]|uniref:Flavin-binding monooxygenase, putative n=1 Tax=Talaromyces stipitatus (strain ATCC 10500 / CBS 375.48 / QM 6759 / NRRL 1006) TaxID=441959 RepID=B8ML04_TALSN|nr:flavin-binding monooxygenase, putative [Talaromyces stipitatus ATCC 10500]EED15420.1 flavin-binding monooxygenase, putative [Talaromyces stipitatus ATCC 10500]
MAAESLSKGVQNDPCIIENRAVDDARPIKVRVMGAGISGIITCIRLMQRITNLDLSVWEKNDDIGGTWYENRYPGCACDIPSHTYQATFEPNLEWSHFYATSKEIHQYWKKVAQKYGAMKHIHVNHKVLAAHWNDKAAKWDLKVQVADGSVQEESCDVFISCAGSLNNWKWPAIPGLHDFEGKLLHTAAWDESYDYKNKRIAVIGNGSSGIQVVPAMLPDVTHIDHYARGRTWLSPTFARHKLDEIGGKNLDNIAFSPETIAGFKANRAAYHKFRKDIEHDLQNGFWVTIKDTPEQLAGSEFFKENMKRRLTKKPELLDQIVPDFPPGCRRLTPGPGYLEALTDEKVEVIKTEISSVDATGIRTADGVHREVDVIVCATGFDTSYLPRFPMTGRNGLSLAEKWKEIPETYISLATNEFPNYFICLGPNAALGHGSLTLLIEKEIDYITQCVAKIQRDNIRSMAPRKEAVERFTKHCEQHFSKTVFSTKCRSWYKGGKEDGRVIAVWPGSSLHALKTFSNPRWEDFEYEYINDNPNGWIGDGWTTAEKLRDFNVDYLDDNQIDFPTPFEVEIEIAVEAAIKRNEEEVQRGKEVGTEAAEFKEEDGQAMKNSVVGDGSKNSSAVHIETVATEVPV